MKKKKSLDKKWSLLSIKCKINYCDTNKTQMNFSILKKCMYAMHAFEDQFQHGSFFILMILKFS